ncbi:inositol monophosphatase family protein [Amycolatopsis sp. NPDC059657]|uniref:inositol monophosphatase family protein n=1 Tax=Amycolatopsis sp. NPDC059657 TaxID=3346899 RepID=UPI00366E55D3
MTHSDLSSALFAAHEAVDLAVEYLLKRTPLHISAKGDRDIVTNADVDIECIVRDLLLAKDPHVGFLGEEHGAIGDQTTHWVLDPVDGTINFAHGNPLFAIALALVCEDQPILGVTALPALGTRYWAADGHGAFRDGKPITVSSAHNLDEALVGFCDYGSGPDAGTRDRLCAEVDGKVTAQARGLRRFGSTALDLVWVADGTLDACILFGDRPWDTASGAIIAREAGARVVDADGKPHNTRSRCLVAAAPGLADSLLPLMSVAKATPYWPQPGATPC